MDNEENTTHPAGDKSILELLQAEYQEMVDIKDVYIPIIGWDKTGLAINYRLPESGAELDRIARKVFQTIPKSDQFGRGITVAMDTMIALSQGLFVKPAGVENYVQLDPNETGAALELADAEELSVIFGWKENEVTTARQVVKRLFANNDMAIIGHAEKLQRWLANTKADITTELWSLGELI